MLDREFSLCPAFIRGKNKMKKLKENRGDFTLNGAFILILVMLLMVMGISVMGIGLQAMKLNTITHEVVRAIEIKGAVDGTAQSTLDTLKAQNKMDIQMTVNASYTAGGNRIQFGDSFSVTLTCQGKLSVGGVVNIPIPLHSTVTGRSEVYWK